MYSMTGYGRCTVRRDGRNITVEIKSVNHRFLDLSFRMPRTFAFLEDTARKLISASVARGHLDIYCAYENLRDDAKRVYADTGLANAYISALNEISSQTDLTDDRTLTRIALLPDVLRVTEQDEDETALRELFSEALSGALNELNAMRLREGEALKLDMLACLDEMEAETAGIEKRYPETVENYHARLHARLDELLSGVIDETRLSQEVALMADKASVAEETVRLRSHISQAREKCALSIPVGRSLDFIVQEMNREANTVSSKSQDIAITQRVIALKGAVEKLREQLQNVE